MPLHFVFSTRNKEKLVDNGHLYVKEKVCGEKSIWKCDQFYQMKCHARVHTSEDCILKRLGEHNHAGNIARVEASKVINQIKEKAITCQESTHAIATEAYVGISSAVSGVLPPPVLLKKVIRNARNSASHAPANPANLFELSIPAEYRSTHANQPFLLFDNNGGLDRFIIFSTSKNLEVLSNASTIYADGTFKTVPPLFSQLYTIHGIVSGGILPLVYVLMAKKTQESYNRVLLQLKSMEPSLSPSAIMTDFERASINAFRRVFPNSDQRGCFFHFTQCIYRCVQSNGLQQLYTSDAEFALKIRMLCAIAFVPVSNVVSYFEHLIESTNFPEEAQPVLDYFEDNWIGRLNRGSVRRQPRHDLKLWNCFESAKICGSKTNNSCEGWHRAFSESIGASHPTIWKFLEILKKEQAKNEAMIEHYVAGGENPPRKKKYKETALRIQKIVNDYENRNVTDYLRGIAHNLSL